MVLGCQRPGTQSERSRLGQGVYVVGGGLVSDDRIPDVTVRVPMSPGEAPAADSEWTAVRCGDCGAPGRIRTAEIPLMSGLVPMRDDGGGRLGWCPRCRP